jgi:hypothetical protein
LWVPEPIATPTCASMSAGASLTTIVTVRPVDIKRFTYRRLSSGKRPAKKASG